MRVLVVEDDSKIGSFVVNELKQNGFAADHVCDGENGLALAQAVTYDAAVLDIMLPKLDGLSLLRHREHPAVRAGNVTATTNPR
jgi:two-component system OmpR family response regulator